nr:uncharacterized protein LOC109164913 [Ipomoea trifida]
MACFIPFNDRNLDLSFFIFRPTIVIVDQLVDYLKHFSSTTHTLGCVHSAIFRSIHGSLIIWYGAWIKKSSDKDRDSLSASLVSMLSSGVSSMAIILEHGFYEAFAGEARDGTPAARFYTGDTVSMNALSLSTREVDLNRFSYACLAIFKDRFLRMDGAKGGACLKSRGLSRVCAVFVWRSLQSCYSYILNDDYRSSVLAYLDGMSMDIKYDIFRVVYVSGENAMDFHFFPPHRLLETKGVHDSNKVAD